MAALAEAPAPPRRPARRSRWTTYLWRLLPLLLLAGTAAGGWYAARRYQWFEQKPVEVRSIHTVHRGDLIVTVVEDGNLESAKNTEIRCQVAGGATIKKIVVDGTIVEQGEQLVELDSSTIDEQILTQRIAYEKARAIRDQAVNDLAAAKIALREYVDGTYLKDLQTVDSQITVAQENLRSAENTLQYTGRMFRKGYVTPLQLEAQEFAVKRSHLDLDMANTAKKVLQEFTFAKMKNELETKVATAEAKASSEQAAFELEESKLRRLETQKNNCIILAPQAGMVVYANESGSRFGSSSGQVRIEEGAQVRESQVILRVPDLAQMQVKVTVHESKVESLRPNMPAAVRIQNRKLTGYVTSVANQPESSSFFSANVKEYAAFVRIDGEQKDLKPGMTAEVEILIDERKNVLTVPIQCAVDQGGKQYCWRLVNGVPEKTEVRLGLGDDRNIEVRAGLNEGDVVLQNPPERSEGSFNLPGERSKFGRGGTGGAGSPGGPGGKPAGGVDSGNPPPGAAGAAPAAGRGPPNFAALDKDGDKRLSRAEAPEPMKIYFDKLDSDGDGYITEAEMKALAERMRGAGGPPPPQ
jgi:HlyD family secretion protein